MAEVARIGIVGGGIAGVGCAWALRRAGFEVELFEARPKLGGNARTHSWLAGDQAITGGLAVLAWPPQYFYNYRALLDELAIAHEEVKLKFFIRKGDEVYAQGRGGALYERHRRSFARWRRMIDFVRGYNRIFTRFKPSSLYRVSLANPMCYLSARRLSQLFGVSHEFWDDIVVALYSSSFLTTRLDRLPAVILPTVDDMISIDEGGLMESWCNHSGAVFDAMTAEIDRASIHLGTTVTSVRADAAGVEVGDEHGARHRFDRVVLAGDARRLAAALDERVHGSAKRLLERVRYVDQNDTTFLEGHAHSDAGVLPAAYRDEILSGYCTYIDIVERPDGRHYENHFVVSSWAPVARGRDAVMLVYYDKPPERALAGPTLMFSNRGAHPDLTLHNLLIARRLRRHQGADRLHFCGSYATPGNGHDLSLLSGLVIAHALGAPYPFADHLKARADFALLHQTMLGRSPSTP